MIIKKKVAIVRRSLLLVVIVFVGWMCNDLFVLPAINAPRGDGEFRNISFRAGPFALPGYTISMAAFDLGKPFRAEYALEQIANIHRKCTVNLAIRNPNSQLLESSFWKLNGRFRLTLLNSSGKTLVGYDARLGDFHWETTSDWTDHTRIHVLYPPENGDFAPDPRERYTILVTYEPDRALEGLMGYVYIRNGGGKR